MRPRNINHGVEAGLRYEEPQQHRSAQPLGRVFGVLVAIEAAYVVARSVQGFIAFHPDYALWPMTLAFLIAWPVVFVGAALVLLRPRFPESVLAAVSRSMAVWLVILVNVMMLVAWLSRPGMMRESLW